MELAGDFNVNFLDSKTNKSVQDFARLTFSHWLKEEIRNSNVQDGGRNYLWNSIENTNERNIQRRIWEATEKPTKSYQWKFWYHHDRNKESSEW